KGEKEKVEEISRFAREKIKERESSFPVKLDMMIESLADGHGTLEEKMANIERMLDEAKEEDSVTLSSKIALMFMAVELDWRKNGRIKIFDTDGKLKEHVKEIIDFYSCGKIVADVHKLIEFEYRWHTESERQKFLKTLQEILKLDSSILSLPARLEILQFVVYIEDGDSVNFEFLDEFDRTFGAIYGGKNARKDADLATRIRELSEIIACKLPAREHLKRTKTYLSRGEMDAVLAAVKTAYITKKSTLDEEISEQLNACHEIASLIIEARSDYQSLNFDRATELYKIAITLEMKLFGVTFLEEKFVSVKKAVKTGSDADARTDEKLDEDEEMARRFAENIKTEAVYAQEMADAEKYYKSGDYDGAIRLTKEVGDKPAKAFMRKIRDIIDASQSRNPEKELRVLLRKYPDDKRIGDLLADIDRQKERESTARSLLSPVKDLLKQTPFTADNVDDISELIIKAFRDIGFTDAAFDILLRTSEKAAACGLYNEAISLLDKSREYIPGKQKIERLAFIKKGIEDKRSQAYREQKKKDALARLVALETTISRNDLKEKDFDRVLKGIKEAVIDIGCDPLPLRIFMRAIKKAYELGYYAKVLEYGKEGKNLFTYGEAEKKVLDKLSADSRAQLVALRLDTHLAIIDNHVTAENLSIRQRLKRGNGGNNCLEYSFGRAEIDKSSMKMSVSKISYDDVSSPGKNGQKLIEDITTAVTSGEAYVMITGPPEGKKIQIFLKAVEITKERVVFDFFSNEDKQKALQPGVLTTGTIRRVQDSSLVLRRNLLRSAVLNIRSRVGVDNRQPSTGHRPMDHLLGLANPTGSKVSATRINFKDKRILRDNAQKKAVEAGLDDKLPLVLVQGPPGTGKTMVTVEMIRQLYDQGKKVLVVSQSNPGIDNLAVKLLDLKNNGDRLKFARVGSAETAIDPRLRDEWQERDSRLKEMADKGKGCVVLGTTNGFISGLNLKKEGRMKEYYEGGFDVVIVEEAGRATLAETLLPASWAKPSGKVILVGDHKQLPAYGMDKKQIEETKEELMNQEKDPHERKLLGKLLDEIYSPKAISRYKRSLFETLWEKDPSTLVEGVHKHLLRVNRRSHPAIARLVSILFYDGKIEIDPDNHEPLEKDTVKLIDYAKDEHIEYDRSPVDEIYEAKDGTSFRNLREARIVADEIERLLNAKKNGKFRYDIKDITVISPYKSQQELIKRVVQLKATINDILFSDMQWEEEVLREKVQFISDNLYPFIPPGGGYKKVLQIISQLRDRTIIHDKGRLRNALGEILKNVKLVDAADQPGRRYISCDDIDKLGLFEVETVDSIQGSENKAVILSLVRSNRSGRIGFMGTKDGLQRLNVAFSRAREKFIIIGDFTHTLKRADPRADGGFRENVEKARKVFGKTVEYVDGLKNGGQEEVVKDIGGREAYNPIINAGIRGYIQKGQAVKFKFGDDPFFYKPYVVENFAKGINDYDVSVEPLFNERQLDRLRVLLEHYLEKYPPAGGEPLNIKDITIGIIRDRAFVNPSIGQTFSIVHTGEKTATMWFGELLLKDILEKENDPDAEDIFDHDFKHITRPDEANREHTTSGYKELVKRLVKRCEILKGKYVTSDFLGILSEEALKVEEKGKGEKVVIGLGDRWIPDERGIQKLLSVVAKLSGKDNIEIVRGDGKALADGIKKAVGGDDYSHVVVLADPETINDPSFDDFKKAGLDKKAFLVSVDPKRLQEAKDEFVYVRLMEMLRLALQLAFKD
ncbi:MAG: AAA domain-containing protein, partial [Candidatus Omnitrophica bacterium]|nr:AAA domain-containing protein [Candidatus Omnitrophota bacterium]